ncbi:MAG: hypothetical protein WA979_01485 [Pacificimonas sp.]
MTDNVQIAQADNANMMQLRGEGARHRIDVGAPQTTTVGRNGQAREIMVDATISITVRELQGSELGNLEGTSSFQIEQMKAAAIHSKSNEDFAAYGRTTAELKTEAVADGYFDSPAHNAGAMAAEARTGGRLDAEFWKDFDPYGGTAGNGPDILPGGAYPGSGATIAMGHDTDWSLGRHFNAGPLNALYGSTASAKDQGTLGLVPYHSIDRSVNLYTSPSGHPDWQIGFSRD